MTVPPPAVPSPTVSAARGFAARWTRIAVIAALAAMAVTLVVLVFTSDAVVRRASRMVVRGEASTIYLGVRDRIQPQDVAVRDRLAAALAATARDGLRYVAVVSPDGIEAEAGTPTLDHAALVAWTAQATPSELIEDRGIVRVLYRRPRALGGDGDLDRRGDGLVFELRPEIADDLSASATRTLLIGVLAALALVALTAWLVRWSLRREGAVRQREQERHLAHLGQMSAVLAHEIRNPLASLKGNAQLLAAGATDPARARAKAERVVDEANRLEVLTNELLEFARAGQLHVDDVDPEALAHEVATATGDRVAVIGADPPRTWPLDRARMRQVLVNLVDNALELSDGPVELSVARRERDLALAVADRGPGIPEADLGKVFEPFFTRRVRGTGLGLAVARRFVELHGGTIRARARDGGGTVFEVVIPRSR